MAKSSVTARTLHLGVSMAALLTLAGPASARSVLGDIGAAVETAAHDTGSTLEKAAHDTGDAISVAAGQTSNATGKALDDVNHALKEVEKVFCDVMTAGKASQGEASCGVNAGVGAGTNGKKTEYYTYNPQEPDEHYAIGAEQTTLPDAKDLDAMERMFGKPSSLEDWEKLQAERLGDLLKPGDRIGVPWVGMIKEVKSPTGVWDIRDNGKFLSTRHDTNYPNNTRWHGGLDLLNKVGDKVYALSDGTVSHISHPTKGHDEMTGVDFITPSNYRVNIYYVAPAENIKNGVHVKAGDLIGTAQDLHPAYGATTPQHVHVTVKDDQGRFVDPEGKVNLIMKHGSAPQQIPMTQK